MKLKNFGWEGVTLGVCGLTSVGIAVFDFLPLPFEKIPGGIMLRILLIALGLVLGAAATQAARREAGITKLERDLVDLRLDVQNAIGAALKVQQSRFENYGTGADILNSATSTDKLTLSFLEYSEMWDRPDEYDDINFDRALENAVRNIKCEVDHVIRCDRKADMPKIVKYIQKYEHSQNYCAHVFTTINDKFPPLDVLVLPGRAAQIEFPQNAANPSKMGPSVVITDPTAIGILEKYAGLLVAGAVCIKDANRIKTETIEDLVTKLI